MPNVQLEISPGGVSIDVDEVKLEYWKQLTGKLSENPEDVNVDELLWAQKFLAHVLTSVIASPEPPGDEFNHPQKKGVSLQHTLNMISNVNSRIP